MDSEKSFANVFFDLIDNCPKPSIEEYLKNLPKYKQMVDNSSDKWLQFILDNAIKDEWFELAAYIRDTATHRGRTVK